MTTINDPNLDSLLRDATALWRAWRADHPLDGDLTRADSVEAFRICSLLIPTDKESLLALVADDRVWTAECPDGGKFEDCVWRTITEVLRTPMWEIDGLGVTAA